MKHGLTLVELAQKVQAQSQDRADYVTDSRNLAATSEKTLSMSGFGEFLPTAHAHGQIAAHTGIPKRYYDRMVVDQPDLWAENVNTWLHDEPKKRMVRTIGD